jgi:6-phosphogluconolactonase (cycloisomerase 2 family)
MTNENIVRRKDEKSFIRADQRSHGNQILVYDRAEDGSLILAQNVDTGGRGGRNEGAVTDPLASQDSLIYDPHHGLLFAVNAGSDTVSVLSVEDDQVTLRQVLSSGGIFPVSLAVHDNLLYVVNAHETGAINGYRIADGKLSPIEGSTRPLEFIPPTGSEQFLNTPG